MLNLETYEFNEINFQVMQALLFKVTDNLLAITCLAGKNELNVNAYFAANKISDLDKELMVGFETEIKDRLPVYETKLIINEISAEDFDEFNKNSRILSNEFSHILFLRFNKLWW